MKATDFYVKVFVVYGSRKAIAQLMGVCAATEISFHYSGEYIYFSTDPTEFLNQVCPALKLKANIETWLTTCFNFQKVDLQEQLSQL
jgi:hypothetical protein